MDRWHALSRTSQDGETGLCHIQVESSRRPSKKKILYNIGKREAAVGQRSDCLEFSYFNVQPTMESRQTFDVDHAIEQWLSPLRSSGVFTKDNLEELAYHIQDSYDSSASSGLSKETRFQNVLQQFGNREALIGEYAQNNQSHIAKEYFLYLLIGAVVSLGIYMVMRFSFGVLCWASVYVGVNKSNLALTTWGSAILLYSFWTYLSWIFFQSANKSSRNFGSKLSRFLRYPGLIIIGFLALLYTFLNNWIPQTGNAHIPNLQLTAAYQEANLVFLTGIPVWWLFILLAWSMWLYKHHTQLDPRSLLANTKRVSFIAGGMISVLSVILFIQTQTGIPMFFLALGLSSEAGILILKCILIGLILLPFLIYGLCHFYPKAFVKVWHLEVSFKTYKYLIFVTLATLFLYTGSVYLWKWTFSQADVWGEIYSAGYLNFNSSNLLLFFWMLLLLLPIIEYNRRYRKGYLIETGS